MVPNEVVLVKHPPGERYKATDRRPWKVLKLPRPGKGFEYFPKTKMTLSRRCISGDRALYFLKYNTRDVFCMSHVNKHTLPYGLSHPYVSQLRFSMNDTVKGEGVQPHTIEQGGPAAEIAGKTQLVEDGTTVEVKPLHVVPMDLTLKPTNRLDVDYIKQWFATPFNLTRGTLAATNTANTFPLISYPSDVLNATYYTEKLKGFRYWRGDAIFTLQVNASKFSCGIYKLAYTPNYGRQSDPNAVSWHEAHNYTSLQRSQLPGVLIDIARETTATFTIPYVAPVTATGFGSIADLDHDFGRLQLIPFSPFNVGAGQDSTCGYTLWVHFENVELYVNAYPQSGVPSSSAEQKSKNIGPVQAAATGLKDTAVALSAIPALTPFAAPAAFYSDILARVSSTFGWSKPANLDVDYKVVRDVMYNSNHYNASDNSRVLALDEKNQVEILPGFAGTDVDELNLDIFLSRPSLFNRFTWNIGQPFGTQLFSREVNPEILKLDTVDGVASQSFTPLAYMCNLFELYRGDIIFKFQFVTTTMHSGRLEFAFNPTFADVPGNVSYTQSLYTYRKIVDLRESSEVIIAMPFNSYSQYRPTKNLTSKQSDVYGTLSVNIIDELVVPDTAPTTIEVLVWAWAAPGFEFAVPKPNMLSPIFGQAIVPAPQSGISEWIGGSTSVKDDSCMAARTCIGERITSLRQLLRVARPMQRKTATYTGDSAYLRPFLIPVISRVSAVTTYPSYRSDLYCQIASMFALSRGGIRIKLIPRTGDHPIYKNFIMHRQYRNDTGPGTSNLYFYGTNASYLDGNNNEANVMCGSNLLFSDQSTRFGFEVTCPFYSEFVCRSNSQLVDINLLNRAATNSEMGSSDFLIWNRNDEDYILMRSGADDLNMGMFVSIPPMISTLESPIV